MFVSQSLLIFLLEATLISLSGVLAPGPVTAVTVAKGSQSPHAGAWVAVGHGLVEVPLMIGVYLGISNLLNVPFVRAGIGVFGGALLFFMGVGMLRGIQGGTPKISQETRSPFLAGVLLSISNPYFFIWWATVGAALILRSTRFGFAAFVIFAILHWLCDFFWDYFLSFLSFKGGIFFGRTFQKVIFGICGTFLIISSARLLIEAARAWIA